jgi:hypothetical protein
MAFLAVGLLHAMSSAWYGMVVPTSIWLGPLGTVFWFWLIPGGVIPIIMFVVSVWRERRAHRRAAR